MCLKFTLAHAKMPEEQGRIVENGLDVGHLAIKDLLSVLLPARFGSGADGAAERGFLRVLAAGGLASQ
jgi:hypothetical protein